MRLPRVSSPAVLVAGVLAPVALIGGWTWAAAARADGFDSVHRTISALAARHAPDRWIMTAGLAVFGICLLAIAAGWVAAGTWARVVLALGGLGSVAVSVLAQPASLHGQAAGLTFVALAVWPAALRGVPRTTRFAVTGLLLALLIIFGLAQRSGQVIGLAERVLAGAESLCPLAFLVLLRARSRVRTP